MAQEFLLMALPSVSLFLVPIYALIIFQEGERALGMLGLFFTLLEWKAENKTLVTIGSSLFALIISVGDSLLNGGVLTRTENK
ncbi:hypothetical protein [Cytobacillus praedii]|uniref:hypothetical protein n=1 Tax=Cytobacillus praedii TaxID=1742358 RepID=UPI002E1A0CD8|nr:hypothetical protein [Cytobacillus praedii]